MRKLAAVLGGLVVTAAVPFGAHAAAADTPAQTCISIPVVAQTVCVPPDGVPGIPQLPAPPTIPAPPAPPRAPRPPRPRPSRPPTPAATAGAAEPSATAGAAAAPHSGPSGD